VKNVLNCKKPAFWIIIAALLICFTAAVCFLKNPNHDSTLTTYEQSGQKLSELSEDECLAFIASLNTNSVGSLAKEVIIFSEKYPQSPAGYSYTVTMDFAENIRKAVNEYYGIDGGNYLIQEAK
jgi:hypothetical protein